MRAPNDQKMGWINWRLQEPLEEEDDEHGSCLSSLFCEEDKSFSVEGGILCTTHQHGTMSGKDQV